MKFKSTLLAVLFSLLPGLPALAQLSPEATLDALHKAGAAADETAFVSLLADDVVFIGLEPEQRLEGQSVRSAIQQRFANKMAWDFRSGQRETRLSADGSVAWFDETLENAHAGHGRASGVLVRDGAGWKIAQYNLTVPDSATTDPAKVTQDNAPAAAAPPKKQCWKISHKTNTQANC